MTARRLAAALLVAGCAHQAPPPAPGETVTLKVAYVVNPALPGMSREQLQAVLAVARNGARENFGVEVEFTEPEELAPATPACSSSTRSDTSSSIWGTLTGRRRA